MNQERRRAQRYAFVASAEAVGSDGVRVARVTDLSITGAYLTMPNPFSKGASIVVKIRTKTDFFQCHSIVAHSTDGLGMGVMFRDVSPPFRVVLQGWLLAAMYEPSETSRTMT
jgi:Ribonuclease G/E